MPQSRQRHNANTATTRVMLALETNRRTKGHTDVMEVWSKNADNIHKTQLYKYSIDSTDNTRNQPPKRQKS